MEHITEFALLNVSTLFDPDILLPRQSTSHGVVRQSVLGVALLFPGWAGHDSGLWYKQCRSQVEHQLH